MLKGKIEKKVVFYICLTALLVLGIKYFDQIVAGISNLWNVMFPLVFGLVIAYVLNIVLVRVERLYFPRSKSRWVVATRRGVGIVLSIVLVLALFILIGRLVIPELGKAFGVIGRGVPVVLGQIAGWLEENGTLEAANALQDVDWRGLANKAVDVLRSGIGSVLNSTITVVGSVVSGVVNFFIGLIFGIYILAGKEKLKAQAGKMLRAYLKEGTVLRIRRTVRRMIHSPVLSSASVRKR